MQINVIFLIISFNCFMGMEGIQAQNDNSLITDSNVVLSIKSIVPDKTDIKIDYEIKNNSSREIWIVNEPFAVYFPYPNDLDLYITKRREPNQYLENMYVKYRKMKAGEELNDSISIKVPIEVPYIVPDKPLNLEPREIVYVKNIRLDFGYYEGNLPENIFELLEQSSKNGNINNIEVNNKYSQPFSGSLFGFNMECEKQKDREEEVEIPLNYMLIKKQNVLYKIIEDPNLPCTTRAYNYYTQYQLPSNLSSATRISFIFKPSLLDYFYPLQSQQVLFNNDEIKLLKSENSIFIEDKEILESFINDLQDKCKVHYGLTEKNKEVKMSFYQDDDLLTSFNIYNDILIEDSTNHYFVFSEVQEHIHPLVLQIRNFDYRLSCATNLRNLWYRLRFYNIFEGERQKNPSIMSKKIYPGSAIWCASLYHYKTYSLQGDIFICPSAKKGACHYAMNPNCKPDSTSDMVLLFETKAGWNQHGGPELFTFDNHDPTGGCVLFNDGSVKFIRTKGELNNLRWK